MFKKNIFLFYIYRAAGLRYRPKWVLNKKKRKFYFFLIHRLAVSIKIFKIV